MIDRSESRGYANIIVFKGEIHMCIPAFITNRPDVCNIIRCNLPNNKIERLQRIQNVSYGETTSTPFLRELHWLKI